MASGTAQPNYHSQLAANEIDVVTIQNAGAPAYEIINDDGIARIDYTIDGSTPVVGGSKTGRCLPACICIDTITVNPNGSTRVQLISASTPHYSIEAVAGPEPI